MGPDTSSTNGTGNGTAPAPTPAPQPPQTQTAPLPTTLDTSRPSAQMQPAQNLPVGTMPKESWGRSVYHGVLSALGGANDVSLARDPQTGKMVATAVKSGPGQQWKRIISGALTGYAAAAATGAHGPGSTSAKMGAGFQAGQQMVEKRAALQRQQANEDWEAQRKQATSNAQNALITHQLAAGVFDLAQKKVAASVADTQRENSFGQLIQEGGEGSKDLGVFHNMDEVMKAFKDDPSLHDHLANGRMVAIPHIGPDGTIDGVHAALVTLDWLNAKTTQDLPLTWFSTEAGKDGKPELKENTFTIPAGGTTNGNAWKVLGQQSKGAVDQHAANVKEQEAQQKETDTEEYRKQQLRLGQERVDVEREKAKNENTGGSLGPAQNMNDAAAGLASGRYIMGKDFPTRTIKGQTTTAELNAQATAYSMAQYGRAYSPEIIRQEAHFANEPRTQAYLDAIDRMIGTPGNEGQIDKVIRYAKAAGLGNKGGAPVQSGIMRIKQMYGDAAAKDFETALSDTQSGLGPLVGNPLLGGGESDLKLKTAREQFGSNPTLDNLTSQAAVVKDVLGGALRQAAGRNRYIQDRYGDTYAPANAPSRQAYAAGGGGNTPPATPPAGATQEVHQGGPNGPLIGHVVNGQYVPLQGGGR